MATTTTCEAFSCREEGVFDLIEDEKFDFDVPISPTDIRETNNDLEDEDEVFFGPVGHRERCVTVNSDLQDDDSFKPMSPLNGEQIAELFKEATAVSLFIKNSSSNQNLGNYEDEYDNKENNGICKILSQTFSVMEDQDSLLSKPDQENNLRVTKSTSPLESLSQENISSQPEFSDSTAIPATPKRVLQERNSEDEPIMPLPSPFKGRKARPMQNVSKFSNSKLPQTQMTLKTRSCFNSPIKVQHVYGVINSNPADKKVKADCNQTSPVKPRAMWNSNVRGSNKGDSSFSESSSKLPVPSQKGVRPPGFSAQPRRRRTSSSSSVSSTSSALSQPDLNETFTVSKGLASDVPSIPSVCPRKVPATRASLKPVNGTNGALKPTFNKPKGRPQPVKALPQAGISSRKAPPTPKSVCSTPGRSKSSLTSAEQRNQSQTPSKVQRSKSFITPNKSATARDRNIISTGQPGSQTPSKTRKPELAVTPRRGGSVTATPRGSLTTVPTPVRRRSSAAQSGTTDKAGAQVQTRGKGVHRPSTPVSEMCVSSSTVTPPNPVPSKATKRKSLSANGQKRRSLLPTPLRSGRITRSQSHRSKPSSRSNNEAPPPFNISPSAEPVKPRPRGPAATKPQPDHNVEPLQSNSRFSDPFSPAPQSTASDPVQEYTGEDSIIRNLIELSPTLPSEGRLIDI